MVATTISGWIGFAIAVGFVVFSFGVAATLAIDVWERARRLEELDELWDDGTDPDWVVWARLEIRGLPEAPEVVA